MTNLKKMLSICAVGAAMLSIFAACSCDKKDTTETPAAVEEANIDETIGDGTEVGTEEDVNLEENATSGVETTSKAIEDVE